MIILLLSPFRSLRYRLFMLAACIACLGLDASTVFAQDTAVVRSVALPTNDIIYEPFSHRVYASVPSSYGSNGPLFGNSITPIDPLTAVPGASVFVGSEPGRVLVTNNGQYLYTATTSATNIVRLDLATQAVPQQFDLGINYGPMYAEDMETVPFQPEAIAVSRANRGLSPHHVDIAIFDNGVKRPVRSAGANVIEFNDSGTRLYGYFNEISSFDFVRWSLDPTGLINGSVIHPMTGFNLNIKQNGGRIYSTNGQVFDPESGVQIGTFPGGTFVPDAAVGRVFVLTQTTSTVTIRAYNTQTLLQTGSITIPNVSGTAGSLIRWGQDGLAFRTGTNVYFVDTSLVPTITGLPQLAISDQTMTEGDTGTTDVNFRVLLSEPSSQPVTVDYATADGTATAGSDYQSTSGTLTFAPGETSKTITVSVNGDWFEEKDETFYVNLSAPTNAVLLDGQGQCTIKNDDVTPQISIDDPAPVPEGNSGLTAITFTVSLSVASRQTVSVSYATGGGTATPDVDYHSASGTVTFAPGQTSKPITVQVVGDTRDENDETFQATLSGATNAVIVKPVGVGTILDDDVSPTAYINSISVTEGDSGTTDAIFTVSLSAPAGEPSSLNFATADGTATAGSDYLSTSGTLNFAVGDTSQTVVVPVQGDTLVEGNETFFLNLSNPMHLFIRTPLVRNASNGHYYEVVQSSGTWTQAKAAAEQLGYLNARGHLATITTTDEQAFINTQFSTSTPTWIGGTQLPGSVEPAGGWTWITGEPFVYTNWNSGEPNNTGGTEDSIELVSGGRWNDLGHTDTLSQFLVEYDVDPGFNASPNRGTATIVDDDTLGGPMPTLSINNVSVSESDSGTTNATFDVHLSAAVSVTVTVNYSTQNGTATVGSDYQSASGQLTFAPGETDKPITVAVLGDTAVENDETFVVQLSSPANATLATATGTGTIVNDDHLPVAVNDAASTDEDTATDINVLANDSDADGDPLRIQQVTTTAATHGTVTIGPRGVLHYVPDPDYNGAAGFDYRITDDRNGAATAHVTVTVRPVNDPPAAQDDSYTVNEDDVLSVAEPGVLGNDTDVDGNTLLATVVALPIHGTLQLSPNGSFVYTPAPNFNGTDQWTYRPNDGQATGNLGTVTVTVRPVNDPPTADDDTATTLQGIAVDVPVLQNDVDVDGDRLQVTNVASGLHGTTAINADGTVRYIPGPGFFGTDFFAYRISDGQAAATATVTVTVIQVIQPVLLLKVAPNIATENAGAGTVIGTVTRSGPTLAALTVHLSSSDTNSAAVPDTITIPAGSADATIPVSLVDNVLVDGARSVTITAVADGFDATTASLLVTDNDLPTLSVTVDAPATIGEAANSTLHCHVSRNTPRGTALLVNLNSSDTTEAMVPASITVPADADTADFDLTPLDDSVADGTRTVTIAAAAPGYVTGNATIQVTDNEVPTLALDMSPGFNSRFAENSGSRGRVSRNSELTPHTPALMVSLSSNNRRVRVPATVTIPAGAAFVDFNITGVDNRTADGPQQVSLSAHAGGFAAGTMIVTVTDNEAASNLSIGGIVRTASAFHNLPVSGVLLTLKRGTVVLDAQTTSATGVYSFVDLPAGNYNVIATKENYTFDPAVAHVSLPRPVAEPGASGAANVSFIGTPRTSIQGRLTRTDNKGQVLGIAGVRVRAQGLGGSAQSQPSASDGSFTITGLGLDAYLVLPLQTGTFFSPRIGRLALTAGAPAVSGVDFKVAGTDAVGPVARVTEPGGSRYTAGPTGTERQLTVAGQADDAGGAGLALVTAAIGHFSSASASAPNAFINWTGTAIVPSFTGPDNPLLVEELLVSSRGAYRLTNARALALVRSLPAGFYGVRVTAVDAAGHFARSNWKRFSIENVTASLVQLSTAIASASTGTVALTFSDGLDAMTAADPEHYHVTIGGHSVAVESAAYDAPQRRVVLGLTEGTLRAGDHVTVSWAALQDANGHALADGNAIVSAH